ncbi:hypothetical protein LDVICp214 [lymphocystis disease virus-China]|uniref:Uncharacterized protein n=1 Tax=lymphocystis disease virus-China TaxID=256729 RepID=Q677Q0_9VIRU|nr:hypothetical protein LDVICp214 [lymphocystis disease virus-China]AAU11057.1 hypothetical protein [lymphocystis disease virus-China]
MFKDERYLYKVISHFKFKMNGNLWQLNFLVAIDFILLFRSKVLL